MTTFLSTFDAFLSVLIVIAALDYLRRIRPWDEPVMAAAFFLVAIGGFGGLTELLRGSSFSYSEMLLHLGAVSYAWSRRHAMFEAEWPAQERRRTAQR